MNSVKTCIAPCTESGESEDRRVIREVNKSGYSSGQSQFAMEEMVWACGKDMNDSHSSMRLHSSLRRGNGFCGSDLTILGR